MKVEYQVRAGKKILGRYKTKIKAGRAMARLLYNHNNLALVTVVT